MPKKLDWHTKQLRDDILISKKIESALKAISNLEKLDTLDIRASMKLGNAVGNLTNYLIGNHECDWKNAKVGMGVTVLQWSDRYAGTIVKVTPCQIPHSKRYCYQNRQQWYE